MKKKLLTVLATGLLVVSLTGMANAITLINDASLGFYNSSLGTILDNTSANFPGANISTGDPSFNNISPAPNLSAAATILGNWLTNPTSLNGYWSASSVAIPLNWTPINTENAIIYKIDAGSGGLNNVVAQFGIDNGIFVWLDGTYLNGWMAPGGAGTYEYTQNIGALSAGDHYLQILREDHGGSTGYHVNVNGDLVTAPVPEPSTFLLFGAGLAGVAFLRRRTKK